MTLLRLLIHALGYTITLLDVLVGLNVDVTQLLAGGAVTGLHHGSVEDNSFLYTTLLTDSGLF